MISDRSNKESETSAGTLAALSTVRRGRARFGMLLVLPALIGLCGCEKAPLPVFPVTGQVTYKGKPAAGATVVLYTTKAEDTSDVAPSAVVKNDGSFAITVYEPGDGAPEGDYVATVQWRKLVAGAGGSAAGPNVLPEKYGNPKTSPIKVSVAGAATQIPPIHIK